MQFKLRTSCTVIDGVPDSCWKSVGILVIASEWSRHETAALVHDTERLVMMSIATVSHVYWIQLEMRHSLIPWSECRYRLLGVDSANATSDGNFESAETAQCQGEVSQGRIATLSWNSLQILQT